MSEPLFKALVRFDAFSAEDFAAAHALPVTGTVLEYAADKNRNLGYPVYEAIKSWLSDNDREPHFLTCMITLIT